MGFFKKEKSSEPKVDKRNWYLDRYQTAVVQRNILALLTLLAFGGIIISVLAVVQITTSKTIEPFVIEIEEKTGITNVIRPLVKKQFAYDEALRHFYLWTYVNAREGYSYHTFEHNFFTVVRLLSAPKVYGEFKRYISISNPDSPVRLANLERSIRIKSIAELPSEDSKDSFTMQIRFVAVTKGVNANGISSSELSKVATLVYQFEDLRLTDEERAINPLGFQVISYRVDNESF